MVVPIKLVAADAGFFPPGPLTLFADMLWARGRENGYQEREARSNAVSPRKETRSPRLASERRYSDKCFQTYERVIVCAVCTS